MTDAQSQALAGSTTFAGSTTSAGSTTFAGSKTSAASAAFAGSTAFAGHRALSALAALLLGGCGAATDDGTAERVVRIDSAGVEIVTSRAPAWTAGGAWRIDPEPDVHIGRADGPADQTLHDVVAVAGAAGALLVAQPTELRVYGDDGALREQFGGAGQGPGEFSRIASALHCGDAVWASDLMLPRVTRFDAAGTVRAGAPRTAVLPPPAQQGHLTPLLLSACSGGGVIGRMSGPRATGGTGGSTPAVQRLSMHALLLRDIDAGLDTLLVYPGSEVYGGLQVPFGRTSQLAATDSLLFLVDNDAPEVRVHGLDGTLRRILRFDMPARAVTATDRDRIRAQYLGGLPPGLLAEIGPLLDAAPAHSTMPWFSGIRVAHDGTLWLQHYRPFRDEEQPWWTVASASGEWLGDVELPAGLAVHAVATDQLLGVWRDDLGIEYVRRYRIVR